MDKATLERKGYSVPALRALARKQLPRMLFDLVDGAAGDEITMRRNEAALAAMELVPTLLAGAPKRDQSVELFGVKLPSPVIIGPTGFAGLLWPRAEIETARAAARFGTIYSTSHASLSSLEDDRRRDAGPEMDADLPLQGPRSHQGIRRARRGGRLSRAHPHRRQPGGGGARPRRAQRRVLPLALESAPRRGLREPSGLAHAHARDALAALRQLRRALRDGGLRPADGRTARSGHRLA